MRNSRPAVLGFINGKLKSIGNFFFFFSKVVQDFLYSFHGIIMSKACLINIL